MPSPEKLRPLRACTSVQYGPDFKGVPGADDVRVVHVRTRMCTATLQGHKAVAGNKTSTTKYNLFTFLPKALFEQYRRVANVFFTLMVALSLTPFSPVRPWTTITPLVIVVGVSMLKEAQEDYKRYKQDREVNARKVAVLNPSTDAFEVRTWAQLCVGDIVRVARDEQMPADLVFLAAEPSGGGGRSTGEGICYVETMNLDGETNLKIKAAPDQVKDYGPGTLPSLDAYVSCEPPNARLYQFMGNLTLRQEDSGQSGTSGIVVAAASGQPEGLAKGKAACSGAVTVPLQPTAILLRGCSLRNTACIYGVVVYAGHDTKIFRNSTKAPSKRSRLERIVDVIILLMFAILFSWCLVSAIASASWTAAQYRYQWYMMPEMTDAANDPHSKAQTGAVNFFVALLLYSYLIPISLYVSIEMVKVVQSMVFMANDRSMYDPFTDTPALARTSNLNEELGMVNTILSDKTGTLTRNVMEFFKCSIAGVSYGSGITVIERANAARMGKVLEDYEDPAAAQYRERFFNCYDARLMDGAWAHEANPATIEMFFRLLAVCHTVIPDGPPDEKSIKYEAESPDEAALVVAAKAFGFFCHKRTNTTVVVRERTASGTADVEYEVLNILEFNSTRKRMSVVIREKATDRLLVFTKGADTVIYERLDPKYAPNAELKELTSCHLDEYGCAGLRTLCLCYAEVDKDWYNNVWQPKWVEAKTSLQERDAKVAAVSEEIERNLRLLGCTAIEDQLQDGVPQCIKQLAAAGIRLWVLTGDKMETAIEIGYACNLLAEGMEMVHISASSLEAERLEALGDVEGADKLAFECVALQLQQASEALGVPSASASAGPMGGLFGRRASASVSGTANAALIIDGKALSYALSNGLHEKLLAVGLRCKAVVCCRVSPLQKAQVTGLVRGAGAVTLAIGDGANDVGMIQRAHIGVGISGQEGMQAVMSADFAIAQFQFLVPLLLVHGHWSYCRLARMINFFFYKNMLFGLTLFVYSFFSAFSGSYLYNDTTMTLFNVLFTSASPLVVGMFDRPVDRAALLKYPQLYRRGVDNRDFNAATIAGWLLMAVVQAFVIIGVVMGGTAGMPGAQDPDGNSYGMAQVGVVMFSVVIVTVHLQLAMVTEQWTWPHHVAIWGSQAVWWVYLLAFGCFPVAWSMEMWHLFDGVVAGSPQYWLYTLLVPAAALLPCYAFQVFKQYLFPDDSQIIREIAKQEQREQGPAALRAVPPAGQQAEEGQWAVQVGQTQERHPPSPRKPPQRVPRHKVAPSPSSEGSEHADPDPAMAMQPRKQSLEVISGQLQGLAAPGSRPQSTRRHVAEAPAGTPALAPGTPISSRGHSRPGSVGAPWARRSGEAPPEAAAVSLSRVPSGKQSGRASASLAAGRASAGLAAGHVSASAALQHRLPSLGGTGSSSDLEVEEAD